MDFKTKKIFLADDDYKSREKMKRALIDAGHQVVIETDSGSMALALVEEAVKREVNVAVLDCYMPNREDGAKVAEALNLKIPRLIVASVSSMWSGIWQDPHYDKDHPYHPDLYGHDINGRQEHKGPDLFIKEANGSPERLAELIGTTEFSLRNEKELAALPGLLEFVQSTKTRRERR